MVGSGRVVESSEATRGMSGILSRSVPPPTPPPSGSRNARK